MSIWGILIALPLLIAAFIYLLKDLRKMAQIGKVKVNQPMGGGLPVIGWLIYLWWSLIGLWPEQRIEIGRESHDRRFKIVSLAAGWLLFIVGVMIVMLVVELFNKMLQSA